MASLAIIALVLLLRRGSATPLTAANSASCVEFMLPVNVTAHNAEYNVVKVNNDIDATAFAIDIDTWSSPAGAERALKNITVSGTYNISTKLCIPPTGSKKTTLQIATHGLVFDKRYWDVSIQASEYSYMQAATDAGYSILAYDRLGTGLSDKPDAYTVVQAPLELEILRGITEMARSGALLKHATLTGHYPVSGVKFTKIVHVGHSFGSLLTTALLTTYPKLSDAAVITGYILDKYFGALRFSALGLHYAPTSDRKLFGDRSSGYIVPGSRSAIQTGFFSARQDTKSGIGGFEPALLDYAYSTRQTATTSEIVSPSQLNVGVAANYAGPVQFVLGEFDYLVCKGDCPGTYDPKMIKGLFPKGPTVDFFVQNGTGHGLTMHRGASLGYKATFDWLAKNGF